MSLYSDFLNNNDRVIQKWIHYFPIYERYFNKFVNQSILFIEIGVYKGGSLNMWEKYFGPYATIVGIDIEPACKRYESGQCQVRIGDQKDRAFLKSVIDEFGNPDIILDDGSHVQEDLWTTFDELYPALKNNGIYFVEDLHTCYWKGYEGGLGKPDTFIEKTKPLIDLLNAWHYFPNGKVPDITKHIYGIHFYDSIIVFEKMEHPKPVALETGNPDL